MKNLLLLSGLLVILLQHLCNAAEYRLKDNDGKTCVVLKSDLKLSLEYQNKENETLIADWAVENATAIMGNCNAKQANLTLKFTNPVSSLLSMQFDNTDGKVKLSSASLQVKMQDGQVFKNPKNANETKVVSFKPDISLGSDSQYFACQTELSLESGNAKVSLTATELQAFNIKNDAFSTEVERCEKDSNLTSTTTTATSTVTTASNTSVAPTTTAVPEPSLLNITIRDDEGVCIVAQVRIALMISYQTKSNETMKANIWIPNSASVSGSCGKNNQMIDLIFYKTWRLQLVMAGSAGQEYTWQRVDLNYTLDNTRFPNASTPGKSAFETKNSTFIKVTANNYYSCISKQTFKLSPEVTLETRDLMLQAFRTSNSTGYLNDPDKCDDDLPTDNVVPIIVGSALAALVLIVLIAYIIGRRRSTGSGYQSV